jgi:hypothetical protein
LNVNLEGDHQTVTLQVQDDRDDAVARELGAHFASVPAATQDRVDLEIFLDVSNTARENVKAEFMSRAGLTAAPNVDKPR